MKRPAIALQAAATAFLLWVVAALLAPEVLPFPTLVIGRFFVLLGDGLALHLLVSLIRVLVAVALALVTAVPLALAMARIRPLDRVLAPLSYLAYPIPKIALLPVLLWLFGGGEASRILLLWLVLFFQILVAIRDAAMDLDEGYVTVVKALGARSRGVITAVLIPAVLPRLLTAMRVGIATALAVLFFAETFFTDQGLGYFIMDRWMQFDGVEMFAGIVGISLLGLLLFLLLDAIENRLWVRRQGGSRHL